MHSKTRTADVVFIQNVERSNIEKLKENTIKSVKVIDFDLLTINKSEKIQDCLYQLIKKNFIANLFIAIFTSFSFPDLPNVYNIGNKSCSQFIKLKQINFIKFKQNVLSNPYNTIRLFIAKECMQYKLYLNKAKHKKYIENKKSILSCLEFNDNSYNYNKVFVEHCLNLPAETFFCFYQILKMFIFYSTPILFSTLKTPRFVFSKKRAKQNSIPLPNVYQIPLLIFDNLLNFFPKTVQFNFNKVFNVQPLKKEHLSNDYVYYSIFKIDSCMTQMNIADRIFANFNIEWCSNKCSVFDHVFDKIKYKTDYLTLDVVNYFSKRYILNQFIKGFNPNSFSCISLNEYLMLNKCLKNIKSTHEIQFKIFLDDLKTKFSKTINKKHVYNLQRRVESLSKCDFIALFNLKFKQEDVKYEYLPIQQIKTENEIKYLDELKYVFRDNTISIKTTKSTLNTKKKLNILKVGMIFFSIIKQKY